jgi:hypothetical protein
MNQVFEEIVGMSHTFFLNKQVTPDALRNFINMMKNAYSNYDIDENELFAKLETAHSVILSSDFRTLDDDTDHLEWFNPFTNAPLTRDFSWHFWGHYKKYLLRNKKWNPRIVEGLDHISSSILSRIEDPLREGIWDRRGMVVGSVQSGKTSNYSALITKAADAGYKLIVVLAGVHNSLRSQTQFRLNEEFLGYDLQTIQKKIDNVPSIGVGKFPDHKAVYTLTHSGEDGDFKLSVSGRAGIIPTADGPPIILIIKKNVSILKNLIQWISSILGVTDQNGRKFVHEIPFLLIDDECDYASVNTKRPERDENEEIITEWDPTTTNRRIRELLNLFNKSIYIGYTATPFANIFIHHDDPHPEYGEDLFPRSFIISLPQPSNYIGPERLFGLDDRFQEELEYIQPLPLIRIVDDNEEFIPQRHKKELLVTESPDSLVRAIKSFILVCAARRVRKEGTPHNSMLIHVTRYTLVQEQIAELVRSELSSMTARIMSGTDLLMDFEEIWVNDFIPTSENMKRMGFSDAALHSWGQIKENLYEVAKRVTVRLLNGISSDTLEYREAEIKVRKSAQEGKQVVWEDSGANVIAIGGDKLSRGLTLDGLSVSYYLRVSTMYDTLMQMGRWFGYRDGYNDLSRIYTTEELQDWYRFIAGATIELRNELNYMALQNSNPLQFGLRVRNHPGRLAVTSSGKSRAAERIEVTFAGRSQETVVFAPKFADKNIKATENFIQMLNPALHEPLDKAKPRYHWKKVTSDKIILFLRDYQAHDIANKVVNPDRHADYIERQNSINELTEWDVVIVSNVKLIHSFNLGGLEINCVERTPNDEITEKKISIQRLLSPEDEMIGLLDSEINRAKEIDGLSPNSTKRLRPRTIREVRSPKRGLLLIYFPAGQLNGEKYGFEGEEIVGYGLSFPASENAIPIEYLVSPVGIEREYGAV